MAIKGKRRTRGGRSVAAAPRPHLVIPKKPFLRRTGVLVVTGLIVVGGIAALVLFGISAQRRESRREAQRDDVRKFGNRVEEILRANGVGQPFATSYLILPQLGQTIGELSSGDAKETQVLEQAEIWRKQATDAAAEIGSLQPEMAALKESRNLMRRALELYAGLARTVEVAATVDGKPRKDLVGALEGELTVAADLFDTGWAKLTSEKARLEIPVQPAPFPPMP